MSRVAAAASPDDDRQQEQALATVLSHKVFPGRSYLYVNEVATALRVSVQHVINLILQGELDAVEVSGRETKRTWRDHWRVPVSAYDALVLRRWNNRSAKS